MEEATHVFWAVVRDECNVMLHLANDKVMLQKINKRKKENISSLASLWAQPKNK